MFRFRRLKTWWAITIHKSKTPAYVVYYIVMPGDHQIQINGFLGISLKEVSSNTYIKHQGLKYWAQSTRPGVKDKEPVKKALSNRARADILNLIFDKKVADFEGVFI